MFLDCFFKYLSYFREKEEISFRIEVNYLEGVLFRIMKECVRGKKFCFYFGSLGNKFLIFF